MAGWLALCVTILAAGATGTEWKTLRDVKVPVPPRVHPRLYLGTDEAQAIAERLKDPVLAATTERLRGLAGRSAQFRLEWEALEYLAAPDADRGRRVVSQTLEQLRRSELPDRQDGCRVTGRMMVTGAIVYDWLYALLTPEQKQAFIKELVRLAKTQECGYPPVRQGSVTGHSSEAMIMRDMLSAGIAIYDEYPEMYDLAAGRFFREHLPARNWLYRGHAHHQGDSYGPYRFGWDTFPLYIFDRLGAGNVYDPEQKNVPYLWIYTTRPDGQRLRAGDTFMHSTARGKPWGEGIGTLLAASYYGDPYLLDQHLRQGGVGENETLFEFLWRDTRLTPKPVTELPWSRYFGSPFGWMLARTGWGQAAVVAEFKINEYNFANHQHLDAGAFQIYYRGALAVDSGSYSGSSGKYGSPHCLNYYWRTIAHNSLLIHDPAEVFDRRGNYGNDGGQRLPNGRSEARTLEVVLNQGYRTGQVLAHGFGPHPQKPAFTLLQGDLTAAYSDKVREVRRSFAFLNLDDAATPAAVVVFDRVVSAQPSFKKFWLLHTLEEPELDHSSATVDCAQHGDRGRLILDALLPPPENLDQQKIGGPGREYWVFGTNYTNDVEPALMKRGSVETANWRVELSPKTARAEDLFLAVMQVTDRDSGIRRTVKRFENAQRVGCVIEAPDRNRAVLFRRDGRRSAEPVEFDLAASGQCTFLIADLEPGAWQVQSPNRTDNLRLVVTDELGAAWLEGPAGRWIMTRK